MIKKYFNTDIIEAVQYTGDNYKEIEEFVSPNGCRAVKSSLGSEYLTIYNLCTHFSMSVHYRDWITKDNTGLKIIDETKMDKYKECDDNIDSYHKIGSISIGKMGAGVDLNWNVLDRNYNGNIDLYIKEKTNEN